MAFTCVPNEQELSQALAPLHLYKNGNEWFAATSLEEAQALTRKHYADKAQELRDKYQLEAQPEEDDELDLDFTQVPDDQPLTFYKDEEGPRDETDETAETKTAAEWAASNGPGYFADEFY
jgi:hypothetical protein